MRCRRCKFWRVRSLVLSSWTLSCSAEDETSQRDAMRRDVRSTVAAALPLCVCVGRNGLALFFASASCVCNAASAAASAAAWLSVAAFSDSLPLCCCLAVVLACALSASVLLRQVETSGKGIKVAHSLAHQPLRVMQLKC